MRHRCISVQSPSEWKNALDGIAHGFAYTWESSFAAQLTTRLNTYLYCFEGEDIRIVCPLSERTLDHHVDIVTPYGVSGFAGTRACPAFPRYWRDFVQARGYVCGYMSVNPIFFDATYYDTADLFESKTLYFLDLTKTTDELFGALDANRRRQLRRWRTEPPPVVVDKAVLTEFLVTRYQEFIGRKKASGAYSFSKETLAYLAGLDSVVMVGAQDSSRIVAVSVFAYTPAVAEYLLNVSLPEAPHHSVPLLWYGAIELKRRGIPLLSLGGGIESDDGVARFKARFGGRELPLRCLKQVYAPDVYARLCAQVNDGSAAVTDYFPAYRRP